MKYVSICAVALAAAGGIAAASAQTADDLAVVDPRIVQLIVYGDDPCPASTEEEIIVCARRPEEDRYRIPEPLRGASDPAGESWASRVQSLEMVGETGIQSCSTVGAGSFTGCWAEMMRQAREDQRYNAEGQRIP